MNPLAKLLKIQKGYNDHKFDKYRNDDRYAEVLKLKATVDKLMAKEEAKWKNQN